MNAVPFLIGALCLSPTQSGAQAITGNELLRSCTSGQIEDVRFCAGYIIGVAEGIRYGAAVPLFALGNFSSAEVNRVSDGVLSYCIPSDAENAQAVEVVARYLIENPAGRHNAARQLIHFALIQGFPCASE